MNAQFRYSANGSGVDSHSTRKSWAWGAQVHERVAQAGAFGGAIGGVFENSLAPGRLERITLQIERLVVRRDAGVADEH